MKRAILACLLLAACAQAPAPPPNPDALPVPADLLNPQSGQPRFAPPPPQVPIPPPRG